jgi:N-acetyltransferase
MTDRNGAQGTVTATTPANHPMVGPIVRLDRATIDDAADLFTALDDPRVWEFGYSGGAVARPHHVDAMRGVLASWLARPHRHLFTVRLVASGAVVGTTSLLDASLADERIHLGGTAYTPAVWGAGVNADCKRLLLGHAFDDCGFGRVKLQTDAANKRSQAAIARLGAVREGVLRRHARRADGTFRDSVIYSVIRDEWPAVRNELDRRIERIPRA